MPDSKKVLMPGWSKFVVGGSSGMLATCVVQPMDMLKTRMQLLGLKANLSTLQVARNVIVKEGFLGFYSGISAALFRQATYTTTRLGVFNTVFDAYKEKHGTPNLSAKVLIGMFAGGMAAFVGTPAEVCLIRMTADGRLPLEKRRNYRNIFNALGRIIKEEGITTLWRGASSTITRAMILNAAQLGAYQQARESLQPSLGEGILLHFCASMISGLITVVASEPLDVVKTRVQNARKKVSQTQVFVDVIRKEGVLGLWNGFMPTYAKIGPHTVLTFLFLEQLNSLYYTIAASQRMVQNI